MRGAAARLEASDDILMATFDSFSLVERVRLATVSRRWQRLLCGELRFPAWLMWRMPAIVERAKDDLRVFDCQRAQTWQRQCPVWAPPGA